MIGTALAVNAAGLGVFLLAAALVLDLGPSRLPALYVWAPVFVAVAGGVWLWVVRAGLTSAIEAPGEAGYEAAIRWPLAAAGRTLAAWVVGELALAAVGVGVWRLPTFSWASLVFCAFAVSFGVALYQSAMHRRLLAGRVRELAEARRGATVVAVQAGLPLRLRLSVALTGLVFFACAFALFTSYARNRILVGHLLEAQVTTALDDLQAGGQPPAGLQVLRIPVGEPPPAELGPIPARDRGTLPEVGGRRVGAFARAADGSLVVLLAPRPLAARRDLIVLVFIMSLVFGLAAGIVHLTGEELARPVMDLAARADEMAGGDLSAPVPVTEPDEVGVLAAAFEHLRTSLQGKIADIETLNAGLEDEVRHRTAELSDALAALKASQARLVQSEKLASLGQLVAGVAHEINNPVNALVNVLDPLEELGQAIADSEAAEDFHDMVRVLRNGAERTRGIVSDLKTFSRLDEAELKSADIREGLRATLHLVQGGLPPGVKVRLDLPEGEAGLPDLLCYPGPLNQVFLNLVTNAVQAVGQAGNIDISARHDAAADQVVVEVRDDGPGMDDAVAGKVFDPFFTTKEVGAGTGLGLSISHGIVARHGGRIDLVTAPGEGAAFRVHLPLTAPAPAGA